MSHPAEGFDDNEKEESHTKKMQISNRSAMRNSAD